MSRSTYYRTITRELREAGLAIQRIANNSHAIYRGLDGKMISVPKKIDNPAIVHQIRKEAHLLPKYRL